MAQYKTGTVSVTNGSATVTGSGTLWSGEIAAGDLFTIVGDNAWYEVASVGSNTSITLSANYAGTTGSGKSYAISRDFTTRLALPYPQKGDIETASIIKRAFEQIDTETNIATANYSATSAPTANDDSGDGYSIGSWWVNVTSDEAYLCVDATVGAAVWTKISVDVPSEIVSLLAGQSVSMASLTLSGGTANGVLYLNGSKVATSGSALWFDGSNLGVGNNLATTVDNNNGSGKLVVGTGSGSQGMTIYSGSSSGNEARITFANSSTGSGSYAAQISYKSGDAAVLIYNNNAERYRINSDGTAIWSVAGSEAMRLTSTGLGVGTSSPSFKLQVASGASGATSAFTSTNSTAYSATSYNGATARILLQGGAASGAANGIEFTQGGSSEIFFGQVQESGGAGAFVWQGYNGSSYVERMRLDSSGNLGLGVTPSAWNVNFKPLQIAGYGTAIAADTNNVFTEVVNNAYASGISTWTYVTTLGASRYSQQRGQHVWYSAASGTAGDAITFTQALTLDAGGNLLAGTTSTASSGSARIVSAQSSGGGLQMAHTGSGGGALLVGLGGGGVATYTYTGAVGSESYSERTRVDSSGNFLVGTSSSYTGSSEKFSVDGSQGNGGAGVAYIRNSLVTGADGSPPLVLFKAATTTTSSARFMQFYADNIATPMGGIVGNGASNVQFATISDVREKTNIQPINGSLAKISALNPVEFNWIASGEHVKAGFIAQDVEEVFPEFVVENMANEGQEARKGLTGGMTGGIIPHLVKAIQEQQSIIEQLTARVAALES